MYTWLRKFVFPTMLAAAITSPLLLTGCEVHGRVYDSYDHAYVQWAPESPYYSQWEHDTHRHHERYEKRNHQEQQEYWQWRKSHQGNHDQNHQHDNH